jgi:hypothetical protein
MGLSVSLRSQHDGHQSIPYRSHRSPRWRHRGVACPGVYCSRLWSLWQCASDVRFIFCGLYFHRRDVVFLFHYKIVRHSMLTLAIYLFASFLFARSVVSVACPPAWVNFPLPLPASQSIFTFGTELPPMHFIQTFFFFLHNNRTSYNAYRERKILILCYLLWRVCLQQRLPPRVSTWSP